MKGYKKLMDFVALVEKAVLAATMIMILVLTVGNVFSRKVIHQSWSFTEELVTFFSVVFMGILFYYGMDKVLAQLANQKRTFVLNWPEWIFWSFVPIGSVCMVLHFIEYCVDECAKTNAAEKNDMKKEDK